MGKCHDFFLCPAPVPTSSFLGFAAAAGEGLIRFASKGCIYSVLLREARKHPGRPGRRDEGGVREWARHPRLVRACTPAPHPVREPAELHILLGGQLQKCEESGHLGSPRARVLGDGAQDRMCFITVNNNPEYCLGLRYLGALGAARCRQPSRKRQRFI